MAVRIAPLLILAACAAPTVVTPPSPNTVVPTAAKAGPAPNSAPPADETLGQCLTRKGVRLYGAHWCKPCHRQLELFGADAKNVPYTDCQPEGTIGNILECEALGIDTYPTWIFADGLRIYGVRSLKWLATSTDCPLR